MPNALAIQPPHAGHAETAGKNTRLPGDHDRGVVFAADGSMSLRTSSW
jgi:hypothetical protein